MPLALFTQWKQPMRVQHPLHGQVPQGDRRFWGSGEHPQTHIDIRSRQVSPVAIDSGYQVALSYVQEGIVHEGRDETGPACIMGCCARKVHRMQSCPVHFALHCSILLNITAEVLFQGITSVNAPAALKMPLTLQHIASEIQVGQSELV